jgi:hypothetical protein
LHLLKTTSYLKSFHVTKHVPPCSHGLSLHELSDTTPSSTNVLSKLTLPKWGGISRSSALRGKNSTTMMRFPLLICNKWQHAFSCLFDCYVWSDILPSESSDTATVLYRVRVHSLPQWWWHQSAQDIENGREFRCRFWKTDPSYFKIYPLNQHFIEVSDATIVGNWKWLFVNGCECKSSIYAALIFLNMCYIKKTSMCSGIMLKNNDTSGE